MSDLDTEIKIILDKFMSANYLFSSNNIIIEYVENINRRKQELMPYENLDDNHSRFTYGTAVLPVPPNGNLYVLLNSNLKNDPWLCETLIHELTHIYDYMEFAHFFCNGDYQKIPDHDNWLPFYFFSEYHAKREGILHASQLYDRDEYKNILNDMLYLLPEEKAVDLFYFSMQYLGKLSAHKLLFPSDNTYLPDILLDGENKMINLFNVLHSCQKFSDIRNNLGELRLLINTGFKHLGISIE